MTARTDSGVVASGVSGFSPQWSANAEIAEEVDSLRLAYSSEDLDVADALCDSHPPHSVAFRIVGADMEVEELTFAELSERSRRLASALRARGVGRGDRIGVLMTKSSRLPVVLVALWRLGAVHVPLFTAFAAPAIAVRMTAARAKMLISDSDQLDKALGLDLSILDAGRELDALVDAHEPLDENVAVGADGLFIQLYTSGTTGTPKGVGVPAFAIAAFIAYMRFGLDVRSEDSFWNAADPGWAYGLYYAIVGPLALGQTSILVSAGFSAPLTRMVLDKLEVTNFAAAPTIYRALKADGVVLRNRLRCASSAGEPLTPDVCEWAPAALGSRVRDHWGQTEHGMAIIDAWDQRLQASSPVPIGSIGAAMPGFAAEIVQGSIALDTGCSPLMWYRGYVDAPSETAASLSNDGRWYLSGDAGRRAGSHFSFASREDDIILAAGYRIAPVDIERILIMDASVAEAAVVGRPDEMRGEQVEAFIVPYSGASIEGLGPRLRRAVRDHYGAHAYPRRVHVVPALPKTPSGKVQRFLLRSLSDADIDEMASTSITKEPRN